MILGLDANNFWSWLERWFAKGKMFNFLSFLGLHERVEMVTKDLTHPNIFYKPLIREVQAWILRSFSVVKALERLGQNYQNSGFFVIPGGVVQVTKDLAPQRILRKPCFRYAQAWFIRSCSDGGDELGPRRYFQIFTIFEISGGTRLWPRTLRPSEFRTSRA